MGNPVNFGKAIKLSTVEALAAALFIADFEEQAQAPLSIFEWGHVFFEINRKWLECYRNAGSGIEIVNCKTASLLN